MSRTADAYVMPSVSAIIRESGRLSPGSSYGRDQVQAKENFFIRLMRRSFVMVGGLIVLAVFVGIIGILTFSISYAAESPTIATLRSQEIPSDGITRVYAPATERSMEVVSP